jgi:GDP-mannose 6-dehydrogenase
MKVSIFGLGYVGTVCAACLADLGHDVLGVDVNPTKVDLLRQGLAPIVEDEIADLVARHVEEGRLSATDDVDDAVARSDLSLICVGTPSRQNGALDTSAVEKVAEEIGRAIARKGAFHSVVIRSTVLPGTTRGRVLPILETVTGGGLGERFGLASNPEFMREGTAVRDFRNPPKTVIGELDAPTADRVAELYKDLPGPVFRTALEAAEMIKYADNSWHALKVAFANEIGSIAKSLELDSHQVMDIFCADQKLNISTAYLKPGFAFGGSCLPKDVRALRHLGYDQDLRLPLLSNLIESNQAQISRGVRWILDTGARRVAFLGFSFKGGTDDLRESPYLDVIEGLMAKGCQIRIFDRNVELARLMGANRDFLYRVIPHIADLMVLSVEDALADAEVVVVTANAPEYQAALDLLRPDQQLLDFARVPGAEKLGDRYHGILW